MSLTTARNGDQPRTPKVDFSKQIDATIVKNQSVLVTGGASGIGKAFATALAQAGAYVTVFDVQAAEGKDLAQQLTGKGYSVQFIQGDVRSWDDQIKAFDAATSFSPYGSLDIVLAVAGVKGENLFEWLENAVKSDDKPAQPDTTCLDINFTGVWYTTHLALLYLRRSLQKGHQTVRSKQIVLVSSMAGYVPTGYMTDYTAAKFGVRGLWKTLRDCGGFMGDEATIDLRTNLIAPWFIKTPMTAPMEDGARKLGIAFAEPDDCVDAMMRIVCDESVHGRAIAVAANGKNFDLCDDFEGHEAGIEFPQHMVERFGSTWMELQFFFGAKSAGGPGYIQA